jgi:hypothetical protein
MDSILKNYMDEQQIERIAHIVIKNFADLTDRSLTEDERDFVIMVSKATFEKYTIEQSDDIYVSGGESQEKLKDLLEQFTNNLSTLIVHYIYSRLEAYILYKQVKTLQGQDE